MRVRRRGAALVLAITAPTALAAGCSPGSPHRVAGPTTTASAVSTSSTTTTTVDPGALPQTRQEPAADDAAFADRARGLWQAIVTDDPAPGMAFFFPLSAYLQVKAISDPAHDWQTRLVAAYREDIHALHLALGADPSSATYAGITVPMAAARWVNPGEEYNRIGYWRVYGSTIHYSVNDQSRVVTIASLISWRGEWYLVHLRAIR